MTKTLALILLLYLLSYAATASHHQNHTDALGFLAGGGSPACRGTIADCIGSGDEEFDLGSEVSRRILATQRYISYDALRRDSVPCSRRGASYYNCRPGAQANPYTRGCSAITRCRS